MDCVTAGYSLNPDGSIRVDNQGIVFTEGQPPQPSQDIGRAVVAFPEEVPLQGKL